MSASTLSQGGTGSIFNLGSVFERLGNTAIDAFGKVAPVWLASELDLDKKMPVAVAPTYQATNTGSTGPTDNLTTTGEGQNGNGVVVRKETLFLLGGGVLVAAALIFLKD